ncbi:T9SS type A sorting domain-containing protein [Flavobacterium urocaniciphilum]|uniref:Por secretion system C-terminal sorting domain-containing protein n=1 Tax=Flavobacterium urocaniciphilum TaxID=1299341 RepID=A0A1H8ZB90_9FLAO|nr:T9SS type A sorting domain-containing protein [Flavobacterium urocaniciphilum]SEP61497.1 Por secretion system C-terminal sorting domain-containing protein [Flavobacterium urocaniciphilum]
MRKLLLLSGMLLSMNSFGQILSETFEGGTFPPTGWAIDNQVAGGFWKPTSGLSAALQGDFLIAGSNSAFMNYITAANTANLISPSFSLQNYTSATFTFKAVVGWSYMIDGDFGDLFAKVSTDGGTTWTQVWVEEDSSEFVDDGDNDPNTDLYNSSIANVSINMAPYLGQSNVKIKFEYVGEDADSVSVDNILVSGVLSSDSFTLSGVKMYPNPVKDMLNIVSEKEELTKVTITDLNGRIVKEVTNNLSQISVQDLSKGIYMVTIESATAKKVEKLIVE